MARSPLKASSVGHLVGRDVGGEARRGVALSVALISDAIADDARDARFKMMKQRRNKAREDRAVAAAGGKKGTQLLEKTQRPLFVGEVELLAIAGLQGKLKGTPSWRAVVLVFFPIAVPTPSNNLRDGM